MSYRLLSKEDCGDEEDCPGVWITDVDPEHVVIVGKVLPSGTVPVGSDEVAVRLRRTTIVAAELGETAVDRTEMREILGRAKKSRFRLETLPQYLVEVEAESLAAWKDGDRVRRSVDESPFLTRIKETTARGVQWRRARILDYPLCDYSQWELWGYQENQLAGENIFVADRASSPELAGLHEDFWLVDDEVVVKMIYDDEGHFLHPELADDATPYLEMRDRSLRHAIALNEYLEKREPDLIR